METVGPIIALASFVISLLIGKYLVNWWFQIDKRMRYQAMQISLLIELCKKQGVDNTRINEIIDQFNGAKK